MSFIKEMGIETAVKMPLLRWPKLGTLITPSAVEDVGRGDSHHSWRMWTAGALSLLMEDVGSGGSHHLLGCETLEDSLAPS